MKHILLLEDDRSVVDLLSTLLEDDGYYVSSTSRIADAKQILQKTKVDLLIADIVLPDGTAFAAIDETKRQNIAYILMTGSWPHMAQLEANGELHLTKPFKLKDFTSQVLQRIGPGDGYNLDKAHLGSVECPGYAANFAI
jgi:DNA-binding response OmpR family regulator